MKFILLVVGKTVEKHYITAINDYVERTKHYTSFDMEVIPELKNTKSLSMEQQKEKEGELILKAIQPGDVVVLLDEHGKEFRSIEFADWVEKKNFFMEGMFLFMRGKCQPRQWKPEELEVRINSIELLSEVKDHLIEKLTITVPLSAVDDQMIMEISSIVKDSPGSTELCFCILDEDGQTHLSMSSRAVRLSVQKELVDYLKAQPLLQYKIN